VTKRRVAMTRRIFVEVLSPVLAVAFIFTIGFLLVGAAANAFWPLLFVIGFVFYIIIRGWLLDTFGLTKQDDNHLASNINDNH